MHCFSSANNPTCQHNLADLAQAIVHNNPPYPARSVHASIVVPLLHNPHKYILQTASLLVTCRATRA